MKVSIDLSIRNMLEAGDYQEGSTLYNLHYFNRLDGRLLSISFASPKGAAVGIIIDEKKSFAVTINDCYYTEPLKNSQSLGLFSDTEEIQDDRLRGLVEEALVFFENLFGVRLDAQQIENKKRHEVERKKLLDQL